MSTMQSAMRAAGIKRPRIKTVPVTYVQRDRPLIRKPARAEISKRLENPAWQDMDNVLRGMRDMSGVLASVYPKIWGTRSKGRYQYEVMYTSDCGNVGRMLRTHERAKALHAHQVNPGSWVEMRLSLTQELVGEMGRAPQSVHDALNAAWADYLACDDGEIARVDILDGRASQMRNRRELLALQVQTLAAMVYLPEDG